MQVVQRLANGSIFSTTDIDPPQEGMWTRFEMAFGAVQNNGAHDLHVRVGVDTASGDGVPFDTGMPVALAVIPGPFAFISASDAGCTVDFDDISLELLGSSL